MHTQEILWLQYQHNLTSCSVGEARGRDGGERPESIYKGGSDYGLIIKNNK